MACGQSFLEVASSPYVTILGPPQSSERRLNFAQCVQLGWRLVEEDFSSTL
jgi:fucose permease